MGWSRANLEKVAKRTGYPVVAAWTTGHGTMGDILGVIQHHTATPNSYMKSADMPTLKILREGRSDLPGPLCNYGLGRSGTIYLVSDGIGWHAGPGSWKGHTDVGNSRFLGIEAENGGRGVALDPWPAEQLDAYHRLVASINLELGHTNTDWNIRHATWATPAGRKNDTFGFDQTAFDRSVQAFLNTPATINKNTQPPEDDMPFTEAQLRAIVREEAQKALGDGSNEWVNADALLPAGAKDTEQMSPVGMILQSYVKLSQQLGVVKTLVADDPTLDQIATTIAEKLADAGGTIDAAAIREALLGIEFAPRANTP